MIEILLGGVVGFAFATVTEGYFLMGRAQRLMTHAELLLSASAALLATVPGKSAPPTAASPDDQPRPWWQRLRRLAELREQSEDEAAGGSLRTPDGSDSEARTGTTSPVASPADDLVTVDDVDLARWQDDGGQEPEPVDPAPIDPPTVEDLRQAWTVPPPAADTPVLDEVDLMLARFTFAAGGRRPSRPAPLLARDRRRRRRLTWP